MGPSLDRLFVDFSATKLNQLTARIRDCLERLSEEQIWGRGGENQNAAGNLVLHLAGNVRQWIVSGVGGEPDTRRRDQEFAARGGLRGPELLDNLEKTVRSATAVIERLTPERLAERIVVQRYEVSVLEAVYHVVEHFAQHTAQIVFITKAATGQDLGYYRHLVAAAPPPENAP